MPTSPGRGNGPRWPAMMPPAVSVWPYISHTLTPSMCHTAIVSAGSGAPPDTTSSSLSKPILLRIGRNTAARQSGMQERWKTLSPCPPSGA